MDDVRQFLRYVIPGLLFIAEIALFFRLVFGNWPTPPSTSAIGLEWALGAAVFGFMLSMIHEGLSWSWAGRGVDYRGLFCRLKKRNILTILDAEKVHTPIDWPL